MGKIRTSKEKQDKRYIKEELMRYHMYESKIASLKNDIANFKKKYKDILNDPPIGGSIIKMPDGTPNEKNIVMRLEYKLNDLENNLQYYESQIHRLNNWLYVLTPEQRKIIKLYVCEYQCQERGHAAAELKCDENNVKNGTERGIERIRKRFKEFL